MKTVKIIAMIAVIPILFCAVIAAVTVVIYEPPEEVKVSAYINKNVAQQFKQAREQPYVYMCTRNDNDMLKIYPICHYTKEKATSVAIWIYCSEFSGTPMRYSLCGELVYCNDHGKDYFCDNPGKLHYSN